MAGVLSYTVSKINSLLETVEKLPTTLKEYLPISGGTLTGNLSGKYITGTWLQSTSHSNLGSAASRFPVFNSTGWIYERTADQILSDIQVTKDWGKYTLKASGWSSATTDGYYTQRVTVSGMIAAYNPNLVPAYSSSANVKSEKEGFGLIDEIETYAGYIIARCAEKPTIDLSFNLYGV